MSVPPRRAPPPPPARPGPPCDVLVDYSAYFQICTNPPFALASEVCEESGAETVMIHEEHITSLYRISHALGSGSFSTVYHAMEVASESEVALKVIDKAAMLAYGRDSIRNELSVLTRCQGGPVVGYLGAFESPARVYVVMQLLRGPPLFALEGRESLFATAPPTWTPPYDNALAQQCLEALAHIHGFLVVHRDIKPESFIFAEPLANGTAGQVKLIDFGLSVQLTHSDERAHGWVGTLNFQAPEVRNPNGYTRTVDTWSLGVVLFFLVTGSLPFYDRNALLLSANIASKAPTFTSPNWTAYDPLCRAFVQALLTRDAHARPDALAALSHTWLTKD